ncbi:sulfatase family protein [Pelagicoccus mobilis]|uniref:Sulfatase n=1 Tax=Pelagicoccus mobilis TaxID=415221 RepID=A0A934RWW0_9BACT|nr:sulfatase [Pelagicoccus mobilis]MBK1875349.1 sulfatase [Pelagicoccus mobilis]
MAKKRPNILFIMSDDHCANAISAYRSSRLNDVFKTPNIDRIANEGVRLDRCFCANAICTPSRATILTGQHSHVNKVKTLEDPLPTSSETFPRVLQADGYQTGLFGKWHLHSEPQGFDDYSILPGQGLYHDPYFIEKGETWPHIENYADLKSEGEIHYPQGTRHKGHVTDLITDRCLDWLEKRDREKPFMLLCHHKAPHDSFEYDARYEHIFDGVEIPEPENLWEDKSKRAECTQNYGTSVSERNTRRNAVKTQSDPDYPTGPLDIEGLNAEERTKAAYQKYLKDYLRTVKGIDDNVGRLLDYLDSEGLAEDTIVIYTSDQGMFLGEHDFIDKRWIYEEALQMPVLARYPREIEAGTICNDLTSNLDFAQTFLDFAEAPRLEGAQGASIRGNLTKKTPTLDNEALYYRYWMHMHAHDNPAHYGIRTDRYKLVFFYGLPLDAIGALPIETPAGWELYDLEKDPNENENVYDDPSYREVQESLTAQLMELKRRYGDEDDDYPELMELLKTEDNCSV